MKKNLIITASFILTAICAFGWGQKGHDTVAYIAECHLTPITQQAIDSILDRHSIVYYANWLDNASHTPEYAYSKTWHYKNIDADQTYESAPLHPDGNIVKAINEQVALLTNGTASKEDSALALKILVHLLGDLHQPMHMGHQSDLGGNRHFVKYFNRDANLHSIWDSNLPESAHKWSYSEWQQQLDRIPDTECAKISEGNVDNWASETYSICRTIYDSTPEGTNISYDYIAQWTPIIESQILYGGIRLADILNAIFDSSYRQNNSVVKK